VEGTHAEQNYLLWLAICKRYRFIYLFATEVLHERFLSLQMSLDYSDYDAFFNRMADWHPEVERIAPSTRKKQRQIVFKMMQQADLITEDRQILPALLTPRLVTVIQSDAPAYLAAFPVSPRDITGGG
jgi:hypothetical protein